MGIIEKTLGGLLSEVTAFDPTREFIVYPDRDLRVTYGEFDARVDLLAKGLLSIGVKPGDHVGIWANNVPDWIPFMFATARMGAVLVTINTQYKLNELEYLIRQADLAALVLIDGFHDSDYLGMVYGLVPELQECERGRLKSEKFPRLKQIVFLGPHKHRGMYNVAELLLLGTQADRTNFEKAQAAVKPHDVVNMQYTSATTGFPKGVMLSHVNILNNGFWVGECQKFIQDDRLCLPVPLFQSFGCVLGVMATLTHGGTLVLIEDFDPLLVLAAVEKEKCTALYGVPTMFIAELNHPMFDMFDLSSLRTGVMAGAPCPVDVMRKVIDLMHCRDITIAYGLTEASPIMTQTRTDDPLEVKIATVGRELPGIEVRVRNPDTGMECRIGEQGELCCRGYNVMKGYYRMGEATATAVDKDGWLHSGDLGIKTEAGNYRVTGRIKDMIIRGGEDVYPREVEEFLNGIPEIEGVQVTGVPNEKYGEEVGAFIKLKKDAKLSPEDVRDFCRGKLARFKVPGHVCFVEDYPMAPSGEIRKSKLKEMAADLVRRQPEAV